MVVDEKERLRRWRLVFGEGAGEQQHKGQLLGGEAAESLEGSDPARLVRDRGGMGNDAGGVGAGALSKEDLGMDRTLSALYDAPRSAGLGPSSPRVARWLGDIRRYFPAPVVQMMQQDALERLDLRALLREPEILESIEPDVNLVATLLSLSRVMPATTKEVARKVVRKVVEEVERRLANQLRQAVRGSLNKASRTRRPRLAEINWHATIRANLKNYRPELDTFIVEQLVGYGRRRQSLRDIILCLDQSGSMATSVVYASIFGAVLASLRAVRTRMVVFDTAVADLTADLADPVDLLFGVQLGGGTNIARALGYCQQLVERAEQTILVLITDLYEGGDRQELLRRVERLVRSGVQVICLLALSDQGQPAYEHRNAQALAALGVPTFACTPDLFPDLMAVAIERGDLALWAARREIISVPALAGD
jgi:Mg-chelatase subunit ChlD